MAYTTERSWLEIEARLFTANGTDTGLVTVESTVNFHVKQKVIIEATGTPDLRGIEVKRVINRHLMIVGPEGAIHQTSDLTEYTVAKNTSIRAIEQPRPSIDEKTHARATYEEEPTMAKRMIPVDRYGNLIDENNPLVVTNKMDYTTVFPLIAGSGLLTGIVFTCISAFKDASGHHIIQYTNNGVAVARIVVDFVNNCEWKICYEAVEFLLQEDGDYLLQEDGYRIII